MANTLQADRWLRIRWGGLEIWVYRDHAGFFFYRIDYRILTDLQYPRRIAYTTAIQRHIDDLLFDILHLSFIKIVFQKRALWTGCALTTIALRPLRARTRFNHVFTTAVRARLGTDSVISF